MAVPMMLVYYYAPSSMLKRRCGPAVTYGPPTPSVAVARPFFLGPGWWHSRALVPIVLSI